MQRVGPYLLEGELGRGAMGVVYRARRGQEPPVALKLILDLGDPDALERFRREAHGACRFDHPHLVRVLDFGVEGGRPYLVLGLLEGPSLQEVLRVGPLPISDALAWARSLAGGLAHAHACGVLHRDVKPENVILTEQGPVLTDFGLAKLALDRQSLTQTGQVLGTPAYMAPEQAFGARAQIGAPSDVYGLGALLYALLCGLPPFRGSSALAILSQVTEEQPAPPSSLRAEVSPALDALVLRCLEKDPQARFPDMQSLAEALDALLEATPEAAPAPGARAARRPLPLGLALAGGALLAAGLVAARLGGAGSEPDASASAPPEGSGQASPRSTSEAARLGYGASLNPVDYVYDAAFLGLEDPREVAARWRRERAHRSDDPRVRVAWGLLSCAVERDPAAAAAICSAVELEVGGDARLEVVRAMAGYGRDEPTRVGAALERALSSPRPPRYARGLYAFWLNTRARKAEAAQEAARAIAEGDPGGAAISALLARQRGDDAAELRAWDQAEALSRAHLAGGVLPANWVVDRAHAWIRVGELERAEASLAEAAPRAPWSGALHRTWAQALLARATRAPEQRPALVERASQELLLSLPRLRAPGEIREVARELQSLQRDPLPAYRALAGLALELPERRERAGLLASVSWSLEADQLRVALGDLGALLDAGSGREELRAQTLCLRAGLRRELARREDAEPEAAIDPASLADLQKAMALQPSARGVWASFSWAHYSSGRGGRSLAWDCGQRALRRGEDPFLRGLMGELELWEHGVRGSRGSLAWLKDPGKRASGLKGGFPAESFERAGAFLRGLTCLVAGKIEEARIEFESLSRRASGEGDWLREEEARIYSALCLAEAGQGRAAQGALALLRAKWPAAQVRGALLLTRGLIQASQGGLEPALRSSLEGYREEWRSDCWLARRLQRLLARR